MVNVECAAWLEIRDVHALATLRASVCARVYSRTHVCVDAVTNHSFNRVIQYKRKCFCTALYYKAGH